MSGHLADWHERALACGWPEWRLRDLRPRLQPRTVGVWAPDARSGAAPVRHETAAGEVTAVTADAITGTCVVARGGLVREAWTAPRRYETPEGRA